MPKTMIGVVDVRDVSLAHLRAIKYPEAANKRILINADSLWITDIARVLAKEYPDLKVTTREFGYCPIKMMSYIDNSVGMILPIWAKVIRFDNSLSRNVLGI